MAERVFGLLELPYQKGHEFGQLFFLRRQRAASRIELFEFRNHTLVLFLERDHPRQRSREELAVCAFVDGRGNSHFFHAPLSYSAWVKNSLRTECTALAGITWPVANQQESIRIAARCCFTMIWLTCGRAARRRRQHGRAGCLRART